MNNSGQTLNSSKLEYGVAVQKIEELKHYFEWQF